MSFIGNAVKSAGRGVHSGLKVVSKATGKIGKLAGKVPLVGPGLEGIAGITINAPWDLAERVTSGKRLDRAVLGHLKEQASHVQKVAPYAQMVVSLVPGIGTGAAAAIAAGAALAKGQPIDKALLAGVRGALPGGPLAKAAFDLGNAVMAGKSLDNAAIQALPIDATAKNALVQGLKASKDIAHGKNVAGSLVDAGRKGLTKELSHALDIGLAMGHAQNIQQHVTSKLGSSVALAKLGAASDKAHRTLKAGRSVIKSVRSRKGYDVGIGLMRHAGVSSSHIHAVRGALDGPGKKGFDLALAAHVGAVTTAPQTGNPVKDFGMLVTHGMMGADPKRKAVLMREVASNPTARAGAVIAVKEVAEARKGWWARLMKALGLS
jgi:hypothetical protein